MQVHKTDLPGLLLIEPKVFGDERGHFFEIYSQRTWGEAGLEPKFIQDSLSFSQKNVLRGLHFQSPRWQAKLVYVTRGKICDVVLDIRLGSPTFGRWQSFELSDANKRQLYIPEGLAHGFCTLSPEAQIQYKFNEFYYPEDEYRIAWNDPALAISWPTTDPILSAKDLTGGPLAEFPQDKLLRFDQNASIR